ncbi:hypothetical protein FRB97_008393, partial [Tulasnella sp. 331]
TSQGTFAWNLDFLTSTKSISSDNSTATINTQGVDYTGLPLLPGMCAASSLQVTADLSSWTAMAIATIQCDGKSSFPVSASTSFVSSAFLDRSSLDANRLLTPIPPGSSVEVENKWAAQVLLEVAGLDILTTLRMNLSPLATSITSLSVRWSLSSTDPLCFTAPVPMTIDTIGFSNATLSQSAAAEELFTTVFYNTTSNFMQTMMAAINLDIGSPCPSFMTQPSMVPDVLYSTPDLQDDTARIYYQSLATAYRTFIDTVKSPNAYLLTSYGFTFPIYVIDYVYVDAAYLCHLSVRKGILSLLIAIVSGTYTVFNSGWGGIMLVAIWYVSRPKEAKYCEGHVQLLNGRDEMTHEGNPRTKPPGAPNSGPSQLTPGEAPVLGYFQPSPGGAPISGYLQFMPAYTERQSDTSATGPVVKVAEQV